MMSMMGLTYRQLVERLEKDGVKPVHAGRLFRVLHRDLEQNPELYEGFLPPLQRWLAAQEKPVVTVPDELRASESEDGCTRKYLLRLADGAQIESVLMGFSGRFTACLSSQVGCAMGCVFCATGKMGFRRHVTAAEMIAQAHHIEGVVRDHHGERVRNLVLMGMGEPLHNFEETMQAMEILTDTRGLNIGPSRVTISTVGHVPGIRRLARHPAGYTLAVSLHAATDEEREALVPVSRRWPLDALLDACREYNALKGRVFFAWTLIGGVNDSDDQARGLVELLRGMDVHLNLIPLNPTDDYAGDAPTPRRILAFQRVLREAGLPSTVRQRRGLDVAAGCGQLAGGEAF